MRQLVLSLGCMMVLSIAAACGGSEGEAPNAETSDINATIEAGVAATREARSIQASTAVATTVVSGGTATTSPPDVSGGAPVALVLAVEVEPLGSGRVEVGAGAEATFSCDANCRSENIKAAFVTLQAFPNTGFVFKSWTVLNQPEACSDTGPCNVTMDRDVTVITTFEQGTGGQPGGSPEEQQEATALEGPPEDLFDCITSLGLNLEEQEQWTLAEMQTVLDNCGQFIPEGQQEATVLEGGEQEQGADIAFILEVDVGPLESGRVEVGAGPEATFSCIANCRFEDIKAPFVTLHAFPNTGFVLKNWTVLNQPETCPGTGPCIITMDQDVTVIITFEQDTGTEAQPVESPQDDEVQIGYSLEVITEGSGIVNGHVGAPPVAVFECVDPRCLYEDLPATSVMLGAMPPFGFVFQGWTVSDQPGVCPGTGPCAITMGRDVTVVATFAGP